MTTDHLGSPRIITDQNGAVRSRRDHDAFGETIYSSQRTTAHSYAVNDSMRIRYAGYEKDTESGLDFVQARYYNSSHGRFTSSDPLNESGHTWDPQTFNRYAYVLNDPLNLVDPSGMLPTSASSSGDSGCSAEYSYEQCGGDKGFWGGGEFGDSVGYDKETLGDLPRAFQNQVSVYLERVSNSQAGYGFISHRDAAASLVFQIFYEIYEDGTTDNFRFSFSVNAHVVTRYWHQTGIWEKIGDFSRGAANNLTFGLVEYVDRNWHGAEQAEIDRANNSAAGQAGDNAGAVLGVVLPGPGKAKGLSKGAALISKYLGKGATSKINKAGDLILISADKTKRVRFDIKRPYPHKNPHMHVEEYIKGKWRKTGQIYPKGVPPF